jgi:prepilin-type N-terminal cleavage/methylation domain-containing protein
MKGAPGGFTIIEVMIVLSISAVMLVSAITAFSGRREATDFSQAVYDLSSEFRSIANDVSSQSTPGSQQYKCSPAMIRGVMRPTLSSAAPTGEDCIYLGRALELPKNSTIIYSYPVFGLRTIYNAGTDSGLFPTKVSDTHPEPAVDSSGNVIPALVNNYTMLNNLKVISAQLNGIDSEILTMYSSLQDNNTLGNEIQVLAMPITGDAANPNDRMRQCIEGGICPSDGTPAAATSWNLCVTDGAHQALMSLKGTPTGIVTKLNMNGCS